MTDRDPKKFDPARAHTLDAPEREQYLPSSRIVQALALNGTERVIDYGAGTGRLALAVAAALTTGKVIAVEENLEMYEHLTPRAAENLTPLLVTGNTVPLPDGSADRVLAINLLHEIRGETALHEMHRLLAGDGQLLIIDWERGRERAFGPPDHLLYTAEEALAELALAGFTPDRLNLDLPFHFALRGCPAARDTSHATQRS